MLPDYLIPFEGKNEMKAATGRILGSPKYETIIIPGLSKIDKGEKECKIESVLKNLQNAISESSYQEYLSHVLQRARSIIPDWAEDKQQVNIASVHEQQVNIPSVQQVLDRIVRDADSLDQFVQMSFAVVYLPIRNNHHWMDKAKAAFENRTGYKLTGEHGKTAKKSAFNKIAHVRLVNRVKKALGLALETKYGAKFNLHKGGTPEEGWNEPYSLLIKSTKYEGKNKKGLIVWISVKKAQNPATVKELVRRIKNQGSTKESLLRIIDFVYNEDEAIMTEVCLIMLFESIISTNTHTSVFSFFIAYIYLQSYFLVRRPKGGGGTKVSSPSSQTSTRSDQDFNKTSVCLI